MLLKVVGIGRNGSFLGCLAVDLHLCLEVSTYTFFWKLQVETLVFSAFQLFKKRVGVFYLII